MTTRYAPPSHSEAAPRGKQCVRCGHLYLETHRGFVCNDPDAPGVFEGFHSVLVLTCNGALVPAKATP